MPDIIRVEVTAPARFIPMFRALGFELIGENEEQIATLQQTSSVQTNIPPILCLTILALQAPARPFQECPVADCVSRLLQPNCPQCNDQAVGTVESLSGKCTITIQQDGAWQHDGNTTEVWWEEAKTVTNDNGDINLICAQGHDWFSSVVEQGAHRG